jgi:uncharacterized protein (TIGR02284 family)
MDNDSQVSALKTLTTTLIDSINGYDEAAENTENQRFKQLFREHAQDRRQVADDLSSEIRRLGGDAPDDGSFMGKTHQTWLDLKAAVTGQDDERVINSVEAGEDYLKEKFETALDSDELTGEVRQAVERAYQSVRSGHDQISRIKHQMDAND